MKQKHLGLIFITLGLVLILFLLFFVHAQKAEKNQYTSTGFVVPNRMNSPDFMVLPLEYSQGLNSGLWGFERILRDKSLITGGNYQQICQSQGSMLKQLSFWLNAPYSFAKQNPTKEVFSIAPSTLTQDGFSHHFVMDEVTNFPDGIKLTRQEVKIELSKAKDQYQLVISSKDGRFSAYKPINPNTWLEEKRTQLKQRPLLQDGSDSEKKIIAFRLGDCS